MSDSDGQSGQGSNPGGAGGGPAEGGHDAGWLAQKSETFGEPGASVPLAGGTDSTTLGGTTRSCIAAGATPPYKVRDGGRSGKIIGDGMVPNFGADLERWVAERTHDLVQAVEKRQKAVVVAERATAAKSLFFASASHDLRQPFQSLRLYHFICSSSEAGIGRATATRSPAAAPCGKKLVVLVGQR